MPDCWYQYTVLYATVLVPVYSTIWQSVGTSIQYYMAECWYQYTVLYAGVFVLVYSTICQSVGTTIQYMPECWY